jgi:hypothetical protein
MWLFTLSDVHVKYRNNDCLWHKPVDYCDTGASSTINTPRPNSSEHLRNLPITVTRKLNNPHYQTSSPLTLPSCYMVVLFFDVVPLALISCVNTRTVRLPLPTWSGSEVWRAALPYSQLTVHCSKVPENQEVEISVLQTSLACGIPFGFQKITKDSHIHIACPVDRYPPLKILSQKLFWIVTNTYQWHT